MIVFFLLVGVTLALLGGALWRWRRAKWRFSLRGLFFFVFVASLLPAWIASCAHYYASQRQAISALRERGMHVAVINDLDDCPLSVWLPELLRKTTLAAGVSSQTLTVEDLAVMRNLPGLTSVAATATDLGDDDLKLLCKMPDLAFLTLAKSPLTGSVFQHFVTPSHLQYVDLSYSNVNDDGLEQLARCKSLCGLTLDGTDVTNAGLAALAGLPALERLSLNDTDITDAGVLATIPTLAKLNSLELSNVQVSVSALDHLSARGVHVKSRVRAPSEAHRHAVTKLETLGVHVRGDWYGYPKGTARNVALNEELCAVTIGRGSAASPELGELLGQLTGVVEVQLESPDVDDEAIDRLPGLLQLVSFRIYWSNISNAGFERFAQQQHPSLKYVYIKSHSFSAESIGSLSAVESLRELHLEGVALDETAITSLSALSQLEVLTFCGVIVDADVVGRLQAALPDARVSDGGASRKIP